MGGFVAIFWFLCHEWSIDVTGTGLMNVGAFLAQPLAPPILLTLLMIAIAGGMFVVPLYAFLTTKCDPSVAARMVAANNIVNSGAMVLGSLIAVALSAAGIPLVEQVLLSAVMCLVSASEDECRHRQKARAIGLREAARIAPQLLAPGNTRLDTQFADVRRKRGPERVPGGFVGEDQGPSHVHLVNPMVTIGKTFGARCPQPRQIARDCRRRAARLTPRP
jgi:MFS family permease